MPGSLSQAASGSVSLSGNNSGCPSGQVKLMGKCVSVAPVSGATFAGTVNVVNHPLNPTAPATGSGNTSTQTQQTMPGTINISGVPIQHANSGTIAGTVNGGTTLAGINSPAAITDTTGAEEPWYKKYWWLELIAAVLIIALALWLIFRKKKK